MNHGPLTSLDDVRAPYNVVAAVGTVDAARVMIETLENVGIEAGHLSLLGAYPAEPDTAALDPGDTSNGPGGTVGIAAAGGAAAGAAVGALTGAALTIPAVGPVVAAGLWAMSGGVLGGALSGVTAVGLSNAWRQTFESVKEGNVVVGVHTDDPEEAELAVETMERLEPLAINRFDD